MALQKLASSFSSGGNGIEQSSPTSTRSFSGSIRGFLQSLRVHAGLSADATSPRASRTGYSESSRPGTPPGSGAQQAYAPILPSLHTESDESDTEHSSKWLTSSAHGMLGFPTEVAPSTSSPRPSIFRSYSSKRSKGAATPAFVTSSGNNKPSGVLPCSAEVPDCSKGTSASAFPSGGTRLSSASRVASRTRELLAAAAGAFTSDNVSPPQTATFPAAFTPTPVSTTSLTQCSTAPPALQLSMLTSCAANAAIPPDPAAPLAVYPSTSQLCAQPNELVKAFGSAQSLLLLLDPEISHGGSIPGTHVQSSVAAASVTAAGAAKPVMDMQVLMPESCPPAIKSTVLGLSGSVDGNNPPNSIYEQGAMCSTADKATSADDGLAAEIEHGKGSETAEQQERTAVVKSDAALGNDVVSALFVDIQATTVEQSSPFKSPTAVELSPVAVSQAVQRLQIRQQQERAASGRFQRISGVAPGGGPLHNHYSSPQAQSAATAAAASQRPLSVLSLDSAESFPNNKDGSETSGTGPSASGSSLTVQQPSMGLKAAHHGVAAAILRSPSVGRRLGGTRAASGSTPFVHPYGLYDLQARAASCSRTGAVGPAQLAGGSGGSLQLANSGGQWDEWLEEAPYMSGGRAIPSLSALEAMRGSVSYTEGQASGADRLQAMMNSAACGDAASYLQQLLLPDNNSTASLELQYSGTQAHVASALPYGSSCGAAYGLGGTGGVGSAAHMHSEIANGFSGADAGLWSGLGVGLDEQSVRPHSSSRAISDFVGSSKVRGMSSPMSSQLLGRRPKSAVVGGPAQASCYDSNPSCRHAHKSATELFEELRQSYNNDATSVTFGTAACGTPSVAPGALSETVSCPADDNDDIQALLSREQLREELQEALWRLVRAKNAEAVSFLLAADPALKANRPLAPLLKDLRSWMYTNMW